MNHASALQQLTVYYICSKDDDEAVWKSHDPFSVLDKMKNKISKKKSVGKGI